MRAAGDSGASSPITRRIMERAGSVRKHAIKVAVCRRVLLAVTSQEVHGHKQVFGASAARPHDVTSAAADVTKLRWRVTMKPYKQKLSQQKPERGKGPGVTLSFDIDIFFLKSEAKDEES